MEKLTLNPSRKIYDLNSICPMGKYQGEQLKRVPHDYWHYMLKQVWFRKYYNNLAYWAMEWVAGEEDIK